jgi:uroporphyrinogen-III synthase
MSCDLQGLSVLVTRPANRAGSLCELIEQHHGRPIRFPAMEIAPAPDAEQVRSDLTRVSQADLLVFVSVNAVHYAFPLLPDMLPADLAIAAVGRATARKLTEYGLDPDFLPRDGYDSEGLLALDGLQDMQGKQIVIVRGIGGRSKLKDELERRGARVDYAEVYQRLMPDRNPANLLTGWNRMIDVVTATSNEILDNLFNMLGAEGLGKLESTPLLVISQRMARHAEALGCQQIYVADDASDKAILAELCLLLTEANE